MMRISVFYSLTIYVLIIKADKTIRCPQDSVQSTFDNKICYLFVKDSKTFLDAESFCNQKNGNLAAVTDQFINNFLSDKASQILGNVNYYWIGGTLETVKANEGLTASVWIWTQGNGLMLFSDWDPTATVSGNCTGVEFRSFWSAIDCNMRNPSVCQIPAEVSFQYTRCDDGWTYLARTDSCYKKFSDRNGIWHSDAEVACNRQGGHLASIHSAEENRFIGELTAVGFKTDADASIFFIGAKRNDNSNNWYWTDGSPFDYENWGYTYYNGAFCSNFWPEYTKQPPIPMQWNGEWCTQYKEYNYLCKKPSAQLSVSLQ